MNLKRIILSQKSLIVLLILLCAKLSIATAADSINELPINKIPNLDRAAESYFSPGNDSLIFNAKLGKDDAYHTYTIDVDGKHLKKINAKGEDACSFYFPDGKRLVFTSTKDNPSMPKGNWSKVKEYPQGAELYVANIDGSQVKRITNNKYYDAEVSVSPDGKWILFTRQIEGRLDLWRMRADGSDEQKITNTPEWQEGGAFYMPDSETIIYRAWKRQDEEKRGRSMTLFTIKHDGSGRKQHTNDDGVNWAPYPAPDGKHAVFAKMLPPHNFEVFLINLQTGKQKQLTDHKGFDGFPSISPDGKTLSFSSSRDAAPGERKLSLYLMDISTLKLY